MEVLVEVVAAEAVAEARAAARVELEEDALPITRAAERAVRRGTAHDGDAAAAAHRRRQCIGAFIGIPELAHAEVVGQRRRIRRCGLPRLLDAQQRRERLGPQRDSDGSGGGGGGGGAAAWTTTRRMLREMEQRLARMEAMLTPIMNPS